MTPSLATQILTTPGYLARSRVVQLSWLQIVRLVVRDATAQRERFMRKNLDAMAAKVGEMQAKQVKLESMGERVSGLAGVEPDELKPLQRALAGGKGGPYVALGNAPMQLLMQTLQGLDEATEKHIDL